MNSYIRSFWLRFLALSVLALIVCSLGVSWSVSEYYSSKANQKNLRELEKQVMQHKSATISDIKFLISDLISWQNKKWNYNSPFSVLGGIDKKNLQAEFLRPSLFSASKQVKLPVEKFKKFPVIFESVETFLPERTAFNQKLRSVGRVVMLVDADQIKSSSLPQEKSKGQILFGILSSKGGAFLSRSLGAGGVEGVFLLKENSPWIAAHSDFSYSGSPLPLKSRFNLLKKKYSAGWSEHSNELLTAGTPLGLSDLYLVASQKEEKFYFHQIFYEVFKALLLIWLIMALPFYLFLDPLKSAYSYLARIFHRYAVWNVFPAPNHHTSNAYISDVRPDLEKLFWRLREEKISKTSSPEKKTFLLSELISKVCKNLFGSSNIEIQTQFEFDIKLSPPTYWLEQALLEILKNALECKARKNKIDIQVEKFEENLVCTIRDYGPGMSSSMMNQAHQAFYSSKEGAKGLGLTLAYSALSRSGCGLYFKNAGDGEGGLEVQISFPLDKNYSVSHSEVSSSSKLNL